MLVRELIKDIKALRVVGSPDTEIEGLCFDSREAGAGSLYVAIRGTRTDGHDFAGAAAAAGAVCVVCEREVAASVTQVIVEDCRVALALIAAAFYGHPAQKLKLIGVTGTNGKTTTTYIIKAMAEAEGLKAGIIGTSGCLIGDRILPCGLTTPDPIELNRLLSLMVMEKADIVAMEVSAHALALKKLEGIMFETAVLTNVTQDHLDFFGDMDTYRKVKKMLFSPARCRYALVNADDACGRELSAAAPVKTFTYGIDSPADFFALNVAADGEGISFVANIFDETAHMESRLRGRFNVYNALAAAGACLMCGFSMNAVRTGLANIREVPGRFNLIDSRRGYRIIIDFAHTPDGIVNVLKSARPLAAGRLICVFGCGGNRDRGKRPLMADAVSRHADLSVITSDNPRFEDPMDIIRDAEKGIVGGKLHVCIENRKKAIAYALFSAKQGDVVAILGKGAEQYQEICGIKHPYNDAEVVNNILEGLAAR